MFSMVASKKHDWEKRRRQGKRAFVWKVGFWSYGVRLSVLAVALPIVITQRFNLAVIFVGGLVTLIVAVPLGIWMATSQWNKAEAEYNAGVAKGPPFSPRSGTKPSD